MHDYSSWALETWEKVASAIGKVHDRGIVFGDLHPNNIMITEDDRIWLIDWEVASFQSDNRRPPIGNPGFMAPEDRHGFQIDAYALALMKLALFAPITTLSRLSPAKVWHVAELVTHAYGLNSEVFAAELESVAGSREAASVRARTFAPDEMAQRSGTWADVRSDIAEAILETATPHRSDRLFPGDIAQFTSTHGGLGFAYGAAGVLWALHRTQGIRYPEGEKWLCERAMADRTGASRGFYEGDHGIAYVLHSLDYTDEATDLLERVYRKGQDRVSIDLRKGAAGIGLNWLHFHTATGDERYLQRAVRTAEELVPRLTAGPDQDPYSSARSPGGLVDGFSGVALFLIRLYEVTGDKDYLDTAADALRLDLAKCDTDPDGSLLLKDEFRVLPYLSSGSAGIGLVLRRYLDHVQDPGHSSRVMAIAKAVSSKFCVFSGLFDGRAGLVLAATGLYDSQAADFRDRVVDQVRGLNWHVLRKNGRRVFPGDQLMRLSSDLATGSAGVLLALGAADQAVNGRVGQPKTAIGLPFLSSG
ncbi:protein kinase domain-containing protein [Nocardiopsis tropica]|uniref:Lanthionine synthetase LanC family protein n=1 Tax=Nocardiopsis tropica TaxID=109330 RepID=A0ABU7KX56_9ACTN|nr:lanthionine synthetase LanC family protein [Nocardiopsis umidischolae]MEE2053890.1 lanthionine synthetase LanC family protein [Nocardiopsis umidischolae]